MIHLDIFDMVRKSFFFIIFIAFGALQFNFAQDSSHEMDVFELKISDDHSAFSPNWISFDGKKENFYNRYLREQQFKKTPQKI